MKKRLMEVLAAMMVFSQTVGVMAESAGTENNNGVTDNTAGVIDMSGIDVSSEELNMAFMVGTVASPWCLAVREGAQAACDYYGVKMTAFDASEGVTQEVENMENIANGNFNMFLALCSDADAADRYVSDMVDAGMPVVTINGDTPSSTGCLSLDQYEYGVQIGQAAAEWINENLDGVANIVLMSEDKLELSILRGDGMQETLEELCPESTIVTREACFTTEDGLNSMETLLTQRDDINCIVCANDTIALGAYQALQNAGYGARDDIALFSADYTEEAVKYVSEGGIWRGTIDIMPYWTGYAAAEIAISQYVNGIPSEKNEVPISFSYTPQSQLVE